MTINKMSQAKNSGAKQQMSLNEGSRTGEEEVERDSGCKNQQV